MTDAFLMSFVCTIILFACFHQVKPATTTSSKFLSVPGCENDFFFPGQPVTAPFEVYSNLQCLTECASNSTCVAVNIVKHQDTEQLYCGLFDVGADGKCTNMQQEPNSRYFEKENPCQYYGLFRRGECECRYGHYGTHCEGTIKDCVDGTNHGYTTSGYAEIQPDGLDHVTWTYCWFSSGSVMIQRRRSAKHGCAAEDFYRTWDEYRDGFGVPWCDYYAGNELIHALTTQRNYSLMFQYRLLNSSTLYGACYSDFHIDAESNQYMVHFVNLKSVTATSVGDGLLSPTASEQMRDQIFCTKDRDCYGCAVSRKSGWWYNTGCAKPDWHIPIGNFKTSYNSTLNRQWKHNGVYVDVWDTFMYLSMIC